MQCSHQRKILPILNQVPTTIFSSSKCEQKLTLIIIYVVPSLFQTGLSGAVRLPGSKIEKKDFSLALWSQQSLLSSMLQSLLKCVCQRMLQVEQH